MQLEFQGRMRTQVERMAAARGGKSFVFIWFTPTAASLGGARDAGSLKLGRRSGALFIVARGRHACPVLTPRARAIPGKLTLFH